MTMDILRSDEDHCVQRAVFSNTLVTFDFSYASRRILAFCPQAAAQRGARNKSEEMKHGRLFRDELFQGAVLRIYSLFHFELLGRARLGRARNRERQYVSDGAHTRRSIRG